jgi:hypothetical protein
MKEYKLKVKDSIKFFVYYTKSFFFFFFTCPHKRGRGGFELVTSASLGMVPAD